ncbi:MAG: hypothetical protein QOD44_2526, partial [Solirubrobacteraceae bacterium]|nr:hypothetical protein [Solirubrobacteraceae bacterium]
MLVADLHVGRETLQGVAPERHDQPRPDDLQLGVEPREVMGDLV